METRKHRTPSSNESATCHNEGFHSFHSPKRPEIVSLDYVDMEDQRFIPTYDPEAIRYTTKFQKRRGRDYCPVTARHIVTARGLSEVTNKMQGRIMETQSDGVTVTGRFNDNKLKHLPLSAYSGRFRSLPKPNHEQNQNYQPPATLSRRDNYEAACWKNEEDERRHNFFSQRQFGGRTFACSKVENALCIPNPALKKSMASSSKAVMARRATLMPTHVLLNNESQIQTAHQHCMRGTSQLNPSFNVWKEYCSNDRERKSLIEKKFDSAEEKPAKKLKSGMLDVLCSATLELGPIQASPSTGCSCPRSNCIKLYCDCFKAGRHCTNQCSCSGCKNTTEENEERILAIKKTLARNPRAFTGGKKEAAPLKPGDIVCNCVKSRCLKLYCPCFHKGRTCNGGCLCVKCLNTKAESNVGGRRNLAIQSCLEKRPDAFTKKPKEVGSGCACKNNKCLKKYCDCFRFDLKCSEKCTCKGCENGKVVGV